MPSDAEGTETQRTLFGGEVEKPTESTEESDEPAVKDCDICGRETVLDGEQGIEHGGQVLCNRGCIREPVAFVAHCRSCGWFYEVSDHEFNRHAALTRIQQEYGGHKRESRALRFIHHDVEYREVATP